MEKLEIRGDWREKQKRLKARHTELTDDDLIYEKGQEEALIGRLQNKLRRSRSDIVKIINET